MSLLGRNGVGKTTTLRSIMGLTAPGRGTVLYNGQKITGRPAFSIAQMGIGFVPEDRRIFPDLSVRENLEVARKVPASPRAREWTVPRVYELFPVLARIDDRKGGHLSSGEQQMLTIGRTLMGNPDLLLLDEPSEGLAPLIVADVGRAMKRLKEEGQSIVLVEQNRQLALDIADHAIVLNTGYCVFDGTARELANNEELIAQHLGVYRAQ